MWATNEKRNWIDAESFYQKKEGHLVSVTSKSVQAYMLNIVGHNKVWIEARFQESEGSWKWSDFSPFEFEAWAPGEPSEKEEESCVELYNAGVEYRGWNNLDCGATLNFTCAKHILPGIN